MKKTFTCINCPLGCQVEVELDKDKNIQSISGNNCRLGEVYVKNELTDPRRMVTSTVKLEDSNFYSVTVKTKEAIPKDKIFEVMKEINQIKVKASVHIGDVLKEDIAKTGIDLIATSERKKA